MLIQVTAFSKPLATCRAFVPLLLKVYELDMFRKVLYGSKAGINSKSFETISSTVSTNKAKNKIVSKRPPFPTRWAQDQNVFNPTGAIAADFVSHISNAARCRYKKQRGD